jgi:hypothetical protein
MGKILLDDIIEMCSQCDNNMTDGCGIQELKINSKNLECHNFFWEIWNKEDLGLEKSK